MEDRGGRMDRGEGRKDEVMEEEEEMEVVKKIGVEVGEEDIHDNGK